MVGADYYRDLLRPIFSGRRAVIVGAPLAGSTDLVRRLRFLGVERCFVVASGPGTGDFPSADDAEWIIVPGSAPNPVAELHAMESLMAQPPADLIDALGRFDPDRRAVVIAPQVSLGPIPREMAGRKVWGRRPPASLALEDKSKIDSFWDRTGVKRAPSVIAPASVEALVGAHGRLNRSSGTVMAGDAREGVHGGAHLVRWIQRQQDLTSAIALFGEHCDRVRVMPFLEGIPCSIHGIVFNDHVVAGRPVEMITLRPAAGFRFLYAGAATFWDPPVADRAYMQDVARRVGKAFRDAIGLGTFTIDGVMTEEGFLPTEMNPRFGAGLNVIGRGLGDIPIGLLCQSLQEGEQLDYRPQEFEALLISAADAHRAGGGWTVTSTVESETHEHKVVSEDGGYRIALPAESADGALLIGPSRVGGFVRFTPVPERTPPGTSLSPRVVSAFALADKAFLTGLGLLASAHDVRR